MKEALLGVEFLYVLEGMVVSGLVDTRCWMLDRSERGRGERR